MIVYSESKRWRSRAAGMENEGEVEAEAEAVAEAVAEAEVEPD